MRRLNSYKLRAINQELLIRSHKTNMLILANRRRRVAMACEMNAQYMLLGVPCMLKRLRSSRGVVNYTVGSYSVHSHGPVVRFANYLLTLGLNFLILQGRPLGLKSSPDQKRKEFFCFRTPYPQNCRKIGCRDRYRQAFNKFQRLALVGQSWFLAICSLL
jgi:hypothetical protein